MKYKLALLQIAVHDGETPAQRLQRVVTMIENLEDVSLAVLPELWVTSFFANNFADVAETLDGTIVQTLADVAKRKGIYLHGGSLVEKKNKRLFNTSVFFSSEGKLVSTYSKMHLFSYKSEEQRMMTHGDKAQVVKTPLGNVGFGICYDVRFPELFRAQVDQGAEVFLLSAAWPYPRLEHWQTLTQARSIENLSYFVACNSVGSSYGTQQLGHSVIYDPWGTPLAQAWNEETTLYATIDLSYLADIRANFPALRDRKNLEVNRETFPHHSARRDTVLRGR
jgi:predicted amidohydrolase